MTKVEKDSLVGEMVRIDLRKRAGEDAWEVSMEADSLDGALYGMQELIQEVSSVSGLPVERVIALLAVRMLAGT